MDLGDVLRALVALGGLSVASLVIVTLRREGSDTGHGVTGPPLSPEVRRFAARIYLSMAAAALVVAAAYLLGREAWGSKAGAGLAIVVAMGFIALGFAVIGVGVVREARQDEQDGTPKG